jgi:hypothetical protein
MRWRKVAAGTALALTMVSAVGTQPASAHGTGVVDLCDPKKTNSCNPAVFAACLPDADLTCLSVANGPRPVDVRLSNFTPNTVVHVWWLNGSEATNPQKSDCTKASDLNSVTRTHLFDATTDANGRVRMTDALPRADWTLGTGTDQWSYGTNWVCATEANEGFTGIVGDRAFTIYPTPI